MVYFGKIESVLNSDIINCDYIFDPNTNNIIIKAIKKIPEGTKLFLRKN